MNNKKIQKTLEEMDKILSSFTEINKLLYCKLKSNNLDNETFTLLMYITELLNNIQLNIKDINIDFIKDFIPTSYEKKQLLCRAMAEKSDMEQDQYHKQLEVIKYLQNGEVEKTESMAIKH